MHVELITVPRYAPWVILECGHSSAGLWPMMPNVTELMRGWLHGGRPPRLCCHSCGTPREVTSVWNFR